MSEQTQAFAANPYRFLETNIVVTGDNPPGSAYEGVGNDRIVWVSIEPFDGAPRVLKKGQETGGRVFNMSFGREQPDAIRAYWCPYTGNSDGDPVMLGNAANYMFTVTMNACSLGIGSATDDGAVRVAHANQANAAQGTTPLEMLTTQGQRQLQGLQTNGTATQVISPQDYVLDGEGQVDRNRKSTTFGMHRTGKAWAFYTLQYKYLGGGYGNSRYEYLVLNYAMGGRWGTW